MLFHGIANTDSILILRVFIGIMPAPIFATLSKFLLIAPYFFDQKMINFEIIPNTRRHEEVILSGFLHHGAQCGA
jgi:hypothetical protein